MLVAPRPKRARALARRGPDVHGGSRCPEHEIRGPRLENASGSPLGTRMQWVIDQAVIRTAEGNTLRTTRHWIWQWRVAFYEQALHRNAKIRTLDFPYSARSRAAGARLMLVKGPNQARYWQIPRGILEDVTHWHRVELSCDHDFQSNCCVGNRKLTWKLFASQRRPSRSPTRLSRQPPIFAAEHVAWGE